VLEVPTLGAGEPDWLSLPARPGVAVFEGPDGGAILIATTADLRALARRRLGAVEQEEGQRPGVDHRAVTARVRAVEAGSSLEADWLYLHEGRLRMPGTHRAVSERWRAWFAHVDPGAEFPLWGKTNLSGVAAPRSASTGVGEGTGAGVCNGPVGDKDAAGRLIEKTVDAFDLCRYPHLLVQAPRAAACAYKEMGRCPAPCDGSEPMGSYRERVMGAVRFLTEPAARAETVGGLTAAMQAAAGAMDFESAAAVKGRLDRLTALEGPGFGHLARLDEWRLVLVLPGVKPGSVRCLLLAGGRLGVLGEAAGDPLRMDWDKLGASVAELSRAVPPPTAQERTDTIAVVARWLHAPKARKRGEAVAIREGDDAAGPLAAAAKLVARSKAAGVVEEREVDVLGSGGG
jgi:DNA polymerase-3 subunit epsilon